MRPAASLVLFTTLSGAGFGLIAVLAVAPQHQGLAALAHWTLAYALAIIGLCASVAHLARPFRARFALSQWRSSWLSREGTLAIATLVLAALPALRGIFAATTSPALGLLVALAAAATVTATAMIYTQLRAVPRWNMPLTPVLFLFQACAGGTLLAGQSRLAVVVLLALGLIQLAAWQRGDRRFAEVGQTLSSATTLGPGARVTPFERSHTAHDWVMDEMAFRIARKHARRLRQIGLTLLVVLPALLAAAFPHSFAALTLAAFSHLFGALTCRWLFFAEAEHVVGLYYGAVA